MFFLSSLLCLTNGQSLYSILPYIKVLKSTILLNILNIFAVTTEHKHFLFNYYLNVQVIIIFYQF